MKGSNRKKIPWKWEKEHQDAFKEAKRMIKSEAEWAFPNWAKPFHLYSNTSDVQLSGTLVHMGNRLVFTQVTERGTINLHIIRSLKV